MRKHLGLAMAAGLAVVFAAYDAAAEKLKIGFLPGVVDPFYQVMQVGVEAAERRQLAALARQRRLVGRPEEQELRLDRRRAI